ncbi:hypothetical protein RMT89_13200 [Streptomyces sp. P17]|nr:hypothetical protein [Streptomyces sp. P17]MDT9696873.1 hypothetical protein [Streptomyces sp. P17]
MRWAARQGVPVVACDLPLRPSVAGRGPLHGRGRSRAVCGGMGSGARNHLTCLRPAPASTRPSAAPDPTHGPEWRGRRSARRPP